MKNSKRERLEAHGWRVGSAAEFLELTPEEAAFVETKLALSQALRDRRTAQGLSQATLAKRLSSSQSRVAKMEAADATVSIDLLLRAHFALGAGPQDVALAIRKTGGRGSARARLASQAASAQRRSPRARSRADAK